MFTRDEINELLKPWGYSLDEFPSPNNGFAYDAKDHKTAYFMAKEWQGDNNDIFILMEDFICHQSDVIEALSRSLSFANKKLFMDNM